LPRSKPQETRRRLRSAVKHADKAVKQLAYIMPLEIEYEEWDEKYKDLLNFVLSFQRFISYIELMLNEKIIDEGVYSDEGAN